MADPAKIALPFTEAIEHFRQKVNLPTRAWTDVYEGQHARAFVVAGATKAGLIEDLRAEIDKALASGTTIGEFRTAFDSIVERHGWAYKGGRNWRTRVIFDTNLRSATAAGRWAQIQRVKERRPYLRYSAVLDQRTRPEHRAWHGTILPVDHEFWATHYPPNGWHCRCTVMSLSERDLTREGWTPGEPPASPLVDHTLNTPDGPATVRTPEGIDPGFGHNAGIAAGDPARQKAALDAHGDRWEPLQAPAEIAARGRALPPLRPVQPRAAPGPRARNADGLRGALRRALGGDEAILTDPTSERVAVGQAIVDHMLADDRRRDGREAFFPLIPELVEDPSEIWIGFAVNAATGMVGLRRRYVKLFDIGAGQTIGLIADADRGLWSGLTFFRGNLRGQGRLRSGLRIFPGE